MIPGTLRLVAQRWTPFAYRFQYPGLDLSAADITGQVRLYADSPVAMINLLTVSSPLAQGFSISVDTIDGVPTSTVLMRINETTIEGILPFPSEREPDEPVELAWAKHITLSPVGKRRWLEGPFIITPGANH
jgi:hypothetical protein